MKKDQDKFRLFVEADVVWRARDNGKNKVTSVLLRGENVDLKAFFDKDSGQLNKEGYKTVTELLLQGLNTNIHGAHQAGVIPSAEHLRHVINRLEDLFVKVTEVRNIPANHVDIDD